MSDLPFNGSLWCNVDMALRNLDRLYKTTFDDIDLSVIEAYLLWKLYEQDGQRATDLAAAVGRPATSFTPILDKLERKNLVERRQNPQDRRSIYIYLSPKGHKLKERVLKEFRQVDETVEKSIRSEDLSKFLSSLQFIQNIKVKE